jgi:hypothetical protein
MFFTSESGSRFFAAVSALAISAVFMATAIIPATPAGILA